LSKLQTKPFRIKVGLSYGMGLKVKKARRRFDYIFFITSSVGDVKRSMGWCQCCM